MSNQPNEKQSQQPPVLNAEKMTAIMGAFSRLSSISQNKIVSPTEGTAREEEVSQLIEFLSKSFLEHAGEFIGCYQLVHQEYLPACNILRKIATRCGFFNANAIKENSSNVNN